MNSFNQQDSAFNSAISEYSQGRNTIAQSYLNGREQISGASEQSTATLAGASAALQNAKATNIPTMALDHLGINVTTKMSAAPAFQAIQKGVAGFGRGATSSSNWIRQTGRQMSNDPLKKSFNRDAPEASDTTQNPLFERPSGQATVEGGDTNPVGTSAPQPPVDPSQTVDPVVAGDRVGPRPGPETTTDDVPEGTNNPVMNSEPSEDLGDFYARGGDTFRADTSANGRDFNPQREPPAPEPEATSLENQAARPIGEGETQFGEVTNPATASPADIPESAGPPPAAQAQAPAQAPPQAPQAPPEPTTPDLADDKNPLQSSATEGDGGGDLMTAEQSAAKTAQATSSSAADDIAGLTEDVGADVAEASGSMLTEGLASFLGGASSLASGIGVGLGAIAPLVAPVAALVGLGEGIKNLVDFGENEDSENKDYTKAQTAIAGGQDKINAMSANISSDQFASQVGTNIPKFGSLAAPTFDTSQMGSMGASHF
tara:strand:+ start:456 stop:1919 length:1464 start_codon:yes stop_codon:yes gene_type:complete